MSKQFIKLPLVALLVCACRGPAVESEAAQADAAQPVVAPAPAEPSQAPALAETAEKPAEEPAKPAPSAEPPTPPAPDGTPAQPCKTAPANMACIPAGPFIRGIDEGPENAAPQASVWLQTFYMDIQEVTFAEYQACVKRRECPKSGPQYLDFSRPEQPINGVSWFDADTYCKAHGKHLPTEAQWEKAARGPDGDPYPWGDAPATCERAIIKGESEGRGCGLLKKGSKPETGRVWPVGSRPPGHYGLHDMAGNSYEWVADWYAPSYEACGEACAGVDPKGPCDGAETCPGYRRKGVRGGSWYWPADRAYGYHRRAHVPRNEPFHHFGFRCAASLEEAAALAAAGPTAEGQAAPE